MTPLMHRYFIGTFVYGAARNLVYAPKMKDSEYMIDRILKFSVWTAASPILAFSFLYCDLRNIEQKLRKMPGPIDTSPW